MTDVTHVVHFHQLGDPEYDVWCPECALPSAITVTGFLESEQPSRHYPIVFSVTRCAECGEML